MCYQSGLIPIGEQSDGGGGGTHVRHQKPFSKETVDERRFARVELPHDDNHERVGKVVAQLIEFCGVFSKFGSGIQPLGALAETCL